MTNDDFDLDDKLKDLDAAKKWAESGNLLKNAIQKLIKTDQKSSSRLKLLTEQAIKRFDLISDYKSIHALEELVSKVNLDVEEISPFIRRIKQKSDFIYIYLTSKRFIPCYPTRMLGANFKEVPLDFLVEKIENSNRTLKISDSSELVVNQFLLYDIIEEWKEITIKTAKMSGAEFLGDMFNYISTYKSSFIFCRLKESESGSEFIILLRPTFNLPKNAKQFQLRA